MLANVTKFLRLKFSGPTSCQKPKPSCAKANVQKSTGPFPPPPTPILPTPSPTPTSPPPAKAKKTADQIAGIFKSEAHTGEAEQAGVRDQQQLGELVHDAEENLVIRACLPLI